MIKNKKITGWMLLAIAILICVAVDQYFHQQLKPTLIRVLKASDLKYQSLVTPQDTKPLAIPEEAIKKGSALKIPILMYHHIGVPPQNADATYKSLSVLPQDFEKQVKWLKDNSFTSIRLEDIYLYSLKQFTMPKKPVVFTFDDGYKDVFLNAVPILKKYGFSGSFAIITQFPGQEQGSNTYASWKEITQAYKDGSEIVCHTQNHFDGSSKKFNADYIFQNLSGCAQDLQTHGIFSNILIYPYGHYSPAYLEQAKRAGFVIGLTVHEGNIVNLNNLMQVPRIRIHANQDFEIFKKLVTE